MTDPHVRRTGADYAEILAGDLPTGPAWPRDPDALPMLVVAGLGETWGDVDGRIDDLLVRESDPRTTFEMLPDWERAFGLPDPCVVDTPTLPERRQALVSRLTAEGGQSRNYFIAQAAALGYAIRIYEYAPVTCGITRCGETRPDGGLTFTYHRVGEMRCGVDPICTIAATGNDEWYWQLGAPEIRYYWRVQILNTRLTWFRCGTGECGRDPLCSFSYAADLECLIRRWRPAGGEVIFDYSQVDYSALSDGTLDFNNPANLPLIAFF